jgi:hypothetical protein
MRVVLEAVMMGPERGQSQRSSGRSPRWIMALVVRWPRWLLAVALLGLVIRHARGDDGGTRSDSSLLAALLHGSLVATIASGLRTCVEQSKVT